MDSVDDVQKFFDEHGEAELMALMRSGRVGEKGQRAYAEWSGKYEVQLRDEAGELARRAVEAAERSAKASERAADASKVSARLAAASAFISLLAILVTLAKEWGWFG